VGEQIPPSAGDFAAGFAAGSRIAGYRLEERIGQGGMAVVFRARDQRLGRQVALKILTPALAGDEAFRRRFIAESRAAAAIDHPHIIPVFEAGEADGVLFIAMRYVPGGDARSVVQRQGPLPAARAAALISPVASALDAAHAVGLVHRDVKPANMLVDMTPGRPDHVYLSDFGLSKAVASSTGITGTGQLLGTLDYISPEQIKGGNADGRADQYALACATFELLTGAPPFRRGDATTVMYAQLLQPPPQLTSRRPDLPSAADEVTARALAKDPADRYPTCLEFTSALRAALGLPAYAVVPAATEGAAHPLTVPAWPGPGQVPGGVGPLADLPTGEAPARAAAAAAPAGGQAALSAAAAHGEPPRRRRVRPRLVAIAAALLLAAAGATAAAVLASGGDRKPVTVPVSVRSGFARLTGDVYVVYQAGKDARARIAGQIKGASQGEVAALYAQPWPYHRPPAEVSAVILHPSHRKAAYSFLVTPVVATRYRVELRASSTARSPLGSSAAETVYVSLGAITGNTKTCARPVCHETIHETVLVPPQALKTEMAKRWHAYFAISHSRSKTPPPPKWLLLGAGSPRVLVSRRTAGQFSLTISYSFRVGNEAYNWNWNTCAKDTVSADGIGLPGHHGCGDNRVPASAAYLG